MDFVFLSSSKQVIPNQVVRELLLIVAGLLTKDSASFNAKPIPVANTNGPAAFVFPVQCIVMQVRWVGRQRAELCICVNCRLFGPTGFQLVSVEFC